jgi:hypothetical protein
VGGLLLRVLSHGCHQVCGCRARMPANAAGSTRPGDATKRVRGSRRAPRRRAQVVVAIRVASNGRVGRGLSAPARVKSAPRR